MARTKGSLNKRTRAALHAVKTGELGAGGISPVDYLLKVMRDSDKPDNLRIEAAKAVAPYLAPKLSSVEMTEPDPFGGKTREELLADVKASFARDPKSKQLLAEIFDVKLDQGTKISTAENNNPFSARPEQDKSGSIP